MVVLEKINEKERLEEGGIIENNTNNEVESNEDKCYLGFCKTPEDVEKAMKIISDTAKKYYFSNLNKYKNNQLELEDLEQIIHYHLMIKYVHKKESDKNEELIKNFSHLKSACTTSMNSVLRGISMKKDIKKKIKDENGVFVENKLIRQITVSSLTELEFDNEDDNFNSNKNSIMFSDNGESERSTYAKMQLKIFSNRLNEESPIYNKIFKVQSFLNDNVNLLSENEQKELITKFKDLLSEVRFNKKDNKYEEVPINKKVDINEIFKRIMFENTIFESNEIEKERIKNEVNKYNKVYNKVCLSMR